MRHKIHHAAVYVAESHKRAMQLRYALTSLLQTPTEKDESWHDLAHDAECIERRLQGILEAMNHVLVEEPAIYTSPLQAN